MLSIESAGKPRAAPTILSVVNRIFGYALAHRYTRNNPAQGLPLSDILKPMPKVEHRAAITKSLMLGQLIREVRLMPEPDGGNEDPIQCIILENLL
jgi:hypothetical protein